MVKVLGYYVDKDVEVKKASAGDAFVISEDEGPRGKYLVGYCPMGQHFELKDDKYLDVCTKIDKGTYKEITKGFYTPEDYL